MHNYTPLGTEIRVGLARKGMTTTELCRLVSEKTGMYCDRSYLSRICRGVSRPRAITATIRDILEIKEEA